MSAQLTRVFNAYDESLNEADTKNYHASIQFSLDGFSFALFDTPKSKFLSFESVEFDSTQHPSSAGKLLEEYVGGHPWLGAALGGVTILFETERSTLVPSPLYDPGDQDLLARFNFEVSDEMVVRRDHLSNADAYLIYSVPGELEPLFGKLFPGHSLFCHASAFIEELLILNKNIAGGKRMFANVRKGWLDISITEENQLLFYNSFPYHSRQDFIYYIIFVIEQLNLNPEEVPLKLSGAIDRKSTLFDEAWTYIRNIGFQDLSGSFKYSYLFNDVPRHAHFTLLNSGLCEL